MQNRDNELTTLSTDDGTYGTYGASQANRSIQSTGGQENIHRDSGTSQKRKRPIGVALSDSEGSASAGGSKRQKSGMVRVRVMGFRNFPLPDDEQREASRQPLATLKLLRDRRKEDNEADVSTDDDASPHLSGADTACEDTPMSVTEDTEDDFNSSDFMDEETETVIIHEDSPAEAEPSNRPGTPSVAGRTFSNWRTGLNDDDLPSISSDTSSERVCDLSNSPSPQPDHAGERIEMGSGGLLIARDEGLTGLDRRSFSTSNLDTDLTKMIL